MRLRKCRYILSGALLLNIIVLYYFWRFHNNFDHIGIATFGKSHSNRRLTTINPQIFSPSEEDIVSEVQSVGHLINPLSIGKLVTVIFREYEFFENDIRENVQSFMKVIPEVKIIVLADAYPYPPLHLSSKSSSVTDVRLIVLHPQIDEPTNASKPELYVNTPFVLLAPDSIRITSVLQVQEMISQLITDQRDPGTKSSSNTQSMYRMVAAKVSGEKATCMKYVAKLREWTLEVKKDAPVSICDGIQGIAVLLMRTKDLFELSQSFARPFPYALFIQTVVHHWKVRILKNVVFQQGRPLFLDPHLKWKRSNTGKERLKMLYEDFGIKKVVSYDATGNQGVEWYGCNKGTARCFGTVLRDTPEYLLSNRWTPPCCLEGLRETARHVFRTLKSCGIRYWLEGGSLLGAARNGDIISWDYDVDIGIYEDDIQKCAILKNCSKHAEVTADGFVWEKAIEGDFYRVQYSLTNHLHVDLFPFFSRNGIMTKRTWFKTHRQDTEFPEHYLRPLATIHFVGVEVSAPNNIRELLEFKFGEGVIENPQYPNPKLISFPNVSLHRT